MADSGLGVLLAAYVLLAVSFVLYVWRSARQIKRESRVREQWLRTPADQRPKFKRRLLVSDTLSLLSSMSAAAAGVGVILTASLGLRGLALALAIWLFLAVPGSFLQSLFWLSAELVLADRSREGDHRSA